MAAAIARWGLTRRCWGSGTVSLVARFSREADLVLKVSTVKAREAHTLGARREYNPPHP